MTGKPWHTEDEETAICEAVLKLMLIVRLKTGEPYVRKHPPSFPAYDELVREGRLTG